jgi:uncharacterized protein (TIGR01244 family)
MNIKEISPDYSVAPQVAPEDMAEIAAAGFRSIMCNRPDFEAPDQPEAAAVRAEAERQGLSFAFLPVVSGMMGAEDLEKFRAAMDELPKPVLAYCRSGTRCTNLWQLTR